MDYANILGIIAGTFTTVSFLPQAVRVHRTRKTRDISLPMYVVFLLGVFSWLCYGVVVKSLPIIIANSATMMIGSYIMAMKIKYK